MTSAIGDSPQETDVVVVGAGMAGLAAAHQLKLSGRNPILLEREPQVGGRVKSMSVQNDLVLDLGAQFVSDFYDTTLQLASNLNLQDELTTRPQSAYLVSGSAKEPLWPVGRLIRGEAIDTQTKLRLVRLALALLASWRNADIRDLRQTERLDTESAYAFGYHILGEEGVDRFFAPLLQGLLYWDAKTTSKAVVLSILKAFLGSKATYRFRSGLATLAQAMLGDAEARMRTDVRTVEQTGDGFLIHVNDAQNNIEIACRAVVYACPAATTASVANHLTEAQKDFLRGVSYSSTAMITYAVDSAEDYPQGALLFPRSAASTIASINPHYSNDASTGNRLVNVYLSDRGFDQYQAMSDSEIQERVLVDVSRQVKPRWADSARGINVQRWPLAIPRFDAGYVRRLKNFDQETKGLRRIAFAGDYTEAPYVEGAVRSGLRAARQILRD